MQPAEYDRRREGKLAPGLSVFAGETARGGIELVQHLAARRFIGAAGLGQGEAPRGPGDEARLKLVLERLEMTAYRG